jgi:hypothetical protein
MDDCDIIVIKSGIVLKSNDFNLLEKHMSKTVKDDWVFKCIEKKSCLAVSDEFKFQNDYFSQTFAAIQDDYIVNKKHYTFEDTKLIFKDFIFYISEEFDKDLIMTIRKAVSFGGGVFYNKLTPLTTHIICNDNKHLYTVRHFGKIYKPSLINQDWVFKSLKDEKLKPEADFKPLSSISILNESNKEIRSEMMVSSQRFRGKTFYILQDSYKPYKYEQIRELILDNFGEIVSEPQRANFIVISDKYYNLSYYLENRIEGFQWVVNHRYIDLCLEKNKYIDLNYEKYLHIFPFSFDLPIEGFNEVVISTAFFPALEVEILEQLIVALGGEVVIDDNSTDRSVLKTVTHLVCYDSKELNKFKELNHAKFSKDLKIVSIDYIAECLVDGKKADVSKFLLK